MPRQYTPVRGKVQGGRIYRGLSYGGHDIVVTIFKKSYSRQRRRYYKKTHVWDSRVFAGCLVWLDVFCLSWQINCDLFCRRVPVELSGA